MTGDVAVGGEIRLTVSRLADRQRDADREAAAWRRRNWWRMLRSGELLVPLVARLVRRFTRGAVCPVYGTLRGTVRRADGTVLDLGVMGRHLVTTAGKEYLASCFDNTAEPEALRYHGFGEGTTAANVADTALETELTTEYASDNTRPTGNQSHTGATYTTAATLTPDAAVAATEWGLFNQAANSGGTLFDRQVFAVVNLNGSTDSLTVTYTLTIS